MLITSEVDSSMLAFLRCGDPVLRYDFEMFSADNASIDAGFSAVRGLTSQGMARTNKVVALFHDQKTLDAVTESPAIIRLFLEEAGFGLAIANSYDAEDRQTLATMEMRRTLVEQLTGALSNRALKKALARAAKKSQFDVATFISYVVTGKIKPREAEVTPPKEPIFNPLRRPKAQMCSEPDVVADDDTDDFEPDDKVMPRRPKDLRGKGIKSRLRPIDLSSQ